MLSYVDANVSLIFTNNLTLCKKTLIYERE